MVWFWLSSILYSFWCGWGNLGLGRLGKGGARTKVTGRIGFRSGQTVMVFWIPDSSPQENHGSNFQHISRSSVVPQATRSGTRGVRRTHLRFYQLPRNARKQMDCSALCSVSACIKKGGFRFRSCRVSQMILKSFNIIHFEPRRVKPRLLKVHRWCVRRTGLFPPLFPIPVKRNSEVWCRTSYIVYYYDIWMYSFVLILCNDGHVYFYAQFCRKIRSYWWSNDSKKPCCTWSILAFLHSVGPEFCWWKVVGSLFRHFDFRTTGDIFFANRKTSSIESYAREYPHVFAFHVSLTRSPWLAKAG